MSTLTCESRFTADSVATDPTMAPPSPSHSRQTHEYLDALLTAIPNDSIPPEIASPSRGAHRPYPKFIDTALRLASGGPARPDDAPPLRDAWPEIQASVQRALHALHPSSASSSSQQQQPAKRKHSPSLPTSTNNKNKKPRHEDAGDNNEDVDDGGGDEDDVPQLTLHALSATAPVRHKIDITLHVRTLRLAHSTTGAHVARCARAALTRVFLLPTRARSSGALQWTALLLAGDKPAPPSPRGAGSKEAKAAPVRFELACSVPDSSKPAAIPRMTMHTSASTSTSASAASSTSASSTREAILALLSSTISETPIALATVERGAPLAGITAFRGVRETSLWFFDDGAGAGILADGRPAEFWAVADLAPGEAGVRVRTATGRTCSVVLTRRADPGEEDDDDEEEGEETEFQMIDGKERERILEWVRRHRGAFGLAKAKQQGALAKGKENGKPEPEATGPEGDEGIDAGAGGDSDSDSDFETESGESDGGSPSSGSESASASASGPGSDAGSDAGSSEHEDEPRSRSGSESEGDGDGGRDDDDDDEVMELEPKHHPLLRAGGLPKMSRAAMDAAVELVVGDLVGQTHRDAPGPGPRPAEDEREEDEDELDD